ncbi:MAG: hypothetical protein Q9227_000874 [Pyrenula ochraceoflavens]
MTFGLLTIVLAFATFYFSSLAHARPGINIDNDPAPPPDKGPPLSAHASRDKSLLPYQIAGIIGAYIVFSGTFLTLLLTVGRRLRRKVEASNHSLDMEMVKPMAGTGNTPVSPIEMNGWPSPTKQDGNVAVRSLGHRAQDSTVSSESAFDEKVIESDKARNQSEMERLYAAVMAHDQQREGASRKATPSPRDAYPSPTSPTTAPSEFQDLRGAQAPAQQPLAHPLSPTHIPTSPTRRSSSSLNRFTKASPLSFFHSHKDSSSRSSNRSSVRGLPISPPISSPGAPVTHAEDHAPLSPRLYTPGPPPPTPGHAKTPSSTSTSSKPKSKPVPAPLKPTTTNAPGPKTTTGSTLPFRNLYSQTSSLTSAPATKTTFLERRESQMHPAGPKTGVPYPHSPYMPFTPVTPVTPGRLMTKDERKRMERGKGLKVLGEEDLVRSDEEVWGDGWN